MTHDDTTTLDSASVSAARVGDDAVDALIVLFADDEPLRAGEALLVPPPEERRSLVFGRGEGEHEGHERARLVRQRPGTTFVTAPVRSSYVSRAQLLVSAHPSGGLTLENVGKSALTIAGIPTDRGHARPGDIVEIGRRFVFLCTRRPRVLPELRAREPRLAFAFGEEDPFGYAGESPEAWRLRDEIALVAARGEHVLVLGESGTGKELAAQAIHALGAHRKQKLVSRNAATVPPGLADAEFFGNAANYPNAGMAERAGLVGEADGSTLFLDEIGELPADLQAHLLRFLDAGEYQRLGDARRRTSSARVIAATNRPVSQLKSDLAARFPLRVTTSPLHDRREDIPLVARHLMRSMIRGGDAHTARFGGPDGEARISRALTIALVTHLYTTHVRQLHAILFRAALESTGLEVDLTSGAREALGLSYGATAPPQEAPSEVTREAIVASLARHGGVREKVWRELGMPNRYVLKRLLKKYGLGDE